MSVRQRILTALACYAVTSFLAFVLTKMLEARSDAELIRSYQMIAELNKEEAAS